MALPGPLDTGTEDRLPDPSTLPPQPGVEQRQHDGFPDEKQVVTKSRLKRFENCGTLHKIMLKILPPTTVRKTTK